MYLHWEIVKKSSFGSENQFFSYMDVKISLTTNNILSPKNVPPDHRYFEQKRQHFKVVYLLMFYKITTGNQIQSFTVKVESSPNVDFFGLDFCGSFFFCQFFTICFKIYHLGAINKLRNFGGGGLREKLRPNK